MEYITYFFGAGASVKAIPAVNGLKDGLIDFRTYVNHMLSNNVIESDGGILYIGELDNLINNIDESVTIDEYAKYLFDNQHKQINLARLKFIFNNYLVFEHAIKDSDYIKSDISSTYKFKNEKRLNTPIDSRYKSFLSHLQTSDKPIPDNVRIISWNYDMQFELAYGEKMGFKSIELTQNKLDVFPNFLSKHNETSNPRLIKMNGTAGINIDHIDSNNTYSEWTPEYSHYNEVLKYQIDNFKMNYNRIFTSPTISFAWEKKRFEELKKHLISIAKNTETLIVVGYSFPRFNKEFDRLFLENLDILRNAYLQVLEPDFDNIVEHRIKPLSQKLAVKIQFYDDENNFFVPQTI